MNLLTRLQCLALAFVFADAVACSEPPDAAPSCVMMLQAARSRSALVYAFRDDGTEREDTIGTSIPCWYMDATRRRLRCGAARDVRPSDDPSPTGRFSGFTLDFRRPFTTELMGTPLASGRDFDVAQFYVWDLAQPAGWTRYDATFPLVGSLTITVTRAARGTTPQGDPIAEPVATVVGTLCGGRVSGSFNLFLAHPRENISPTE